ncbi:MAG: TAXI family TRAP transporter solute-binding subunit [Desulfobacteraceae bacterium]|nr:MAG: TAXI family TRAP transporter solute-binding subunit [Desulfobacteraceae bacterium]
MNVFFTFSLSGMIFLSSVASASAGEALRLGTAPAGSLSFTFGAALSQLIGKHTDMRVEVLPQGDVVALPLMESREMDLIAIANDALGYAYDGKGIYEKQTDGRGFDLRVLALGARYPATIVVAGDSGIKDYRGLKGKRVVLDYATQQAFSLGSRASLVSGGLRESDVTVLSASNIQTAVQLLLERKADGIFGRIGMPALRRLEANRKGAMYLSSGEERWEEVQRISNAYLPMKLKKPFGVPEGAVFVAQNLSLAARPDLPEEIAYKIVKVLWERESDLAKHHPQFCHLVKERFASEVSTAPYHPGAIRFFSEKGIWLNKMQARQENLLYRYGRLAIR